MEYVLIIVIPIILATVLYRMGINAGWYQKARADELSAKTEIQRDIESRSINKQWRDHNADVRFWKKILHESNSPLELRTAQLTLQYLAEQRRSLPQPNNPDYQAEPIPQIDVTKLLTNRPTSQENSHA